MPTSRFANAWGYWAVATVVAAVLVIDAVIVRNWVLTVGWGVLGVYLALRTVLSRRRSARTRR